MRHSLRYGKSNEVTDLKLLEAAIDGLVNIPGVNQDVAPTLLPPPSYLWHSITLQKADAYKSLTY